jgi:hypothetical protein
VLGSRFPGGCPQLLALSSESRAAVTAAIASGVPLPPPPEPTRAAWQAALEACLEACAARPGSASCGAAGLEAPLRTLGGPAISTLRLVAADLDPLLRRALAYPRTAPLVDGVRRAAERLHVDLGWPETLVVDRPESPLSCPSVRRLGQSEIPRVVVVADASGSARLVLQPVAQLVGGKLRLRGDLRWRFPGKPISLTIDAATLRAELDAAGAAAAELQPVEPIATSAPQGAVGLYLHRDLTVAQVAPLLAALHGAGHRALSLLACAGGRVGPLPGDAVRLAPRPLRRMPLVRLSPPTLRTPEHVQPLATWGELVAAVQLVGLPVRIEVP